MATLKYDVETNADWEEHFYHGSVSIIQGMATTDDPLSIESLQYRGFTLWDQEVEDAKVAAKAAADAEAIALAESAVTSGVDDEVELELNASKKPRPKKVVSTD